jgi:hypothetical protein
VGDVQVILRHLAPVVFLIDTANIFVSSLSTHLRGAAGETPTSSVAPKTKRRRDGFADCPLKCIKFFF